MPQFILIAYDAKDDGAYDRRMSVRDAHLASIAKARSEGKIICGLALTDANEKMTGSLIVTNFAKREHFDTWLAEDPYTTNKVWEQIIVLDGKLAPAFQDLLQVKKAA